MKREITSDVLARRLEASDIKEITMDEIFALFRNERGLSEFAPDGICQEDPRDGSIVVFNSKRAKRPHDNRDERKIEETAQKPCPVCEGHTTGIVDVEKQSDGLTFINKNLYPCFYVKDNLDKAALKSPPHSYDGSGEGPSFGLHFLQWTSSKHDSDWKI